MARVKINAQIFNFLATYPSMSLVSSVSEDFIIEGDFPIHVQIGDDPAYLVDESYRIRMVVPHDYPVSLPVVYDAEKSSEIPDSPEFHKESDGSFCLGSPQDLFFLLTNDSSLVKFAHTCIEPYLGAALLKLRKSCPFPQGELLHGVQGLEQAFEERYAVSLTIEELQQVFDLLGKNKRAANKQPCPCGSGKRLGLCWCAKKQLVCDIREKHEYPRQTYRNIARSYYKYVKKKRKINSAEKVDL